MEYLAETCVFEPTDGEDVGIGATSIALRENSAAAQQTADEPRGSIARARIAPTGTLTDPDGHHPSQFHGVDVEERPKPAPFTGGHGAASARWKASTSRVMQMNNVTSKLILVRFPPDILFNRS